MRKMIRDPDSPVYDHAPLVQPPKLSKNLSKKSILLRDLQIRQKSDEYRFFFRLPQTELLDGLIKANLWTPYTKRYNAGSIYLSENFFCFKSDVKDLVGLVIPLRIIKVTKRMAHFLLDYLFLLFFFFCFFFSQLKKSSIHQILVLKINCWSLPKKWPFNFPMSWIVIFS